MRRTPLALPAFASATWPSTITSVPPWTAEDDHVNAPRGPAERSRIGEITLDQLGATFDEGLEFALVARMVSHQQADTGAEERQEVMGDAAAKHAGGPGEEDCVCHSFQSFAA